MKHPATSNHQTPGGRAYARSGRIALFAAAGLLLAAGGPVTAADSDVTKGENPFRITEVSQDSGKIVY